MKKQLTMTKKPITLCEEDLRTVAAGYDLADAIADADGADARAARQQAYNSFEAFDQKTNALFNTLSSILKTLY